MHGFLMGFEREGAADHPMSAGGMYDPPMVRPLSPPVLAFVVGCAETPESPAPREGAESVDYGPVQTCADPVVGLDGFVESAAARGIDLEIVGNPDPSSCNYIPGSVVAHDLDLDGDVDLLFGDELEFPALYANDGTGAFTRVPVELGAMEDGRRFYGLAVADIDGDRLPEVFRAGDGFVVMSRNLGGMSFGAWELVYDTPGFPRVCHAGIAFGDIDEDGDLDMVLPGLDVVPEAGAVVTVDSAGWIPGLDVLLENTGEAWVVDRYLSPWGDAQPGFSLVQQFTDKDNDGDLDLMSCTDRPLGGSLPPMAFWENVGRGGGGLPELVDVAPEEGANVLASAMGLGVNDLNQDGYLDYCMSDVAPALTCLLSLDGGGYYDAARAIGFVPDVATHPTLPADWYEREPMSAETFWVSWGLAMVDLDNDRWLERGVAAGPPPDGGSVALSNIHDWQPDWLWMGSRAGGFEAQDPASHAFNSTDAHYGLVHADLDGDGYRELIVGPFEGRPKIYDNPCGANSWLEIEVVGPASNRGAYGTQVWVNRGNWVDRQQVESLVAVGQGPGTLHFGLGDLQSVERVVVKWLDAEPTVLEDVAVNRKLTIWHPDAR
ncbi:MAG: CRTAC1 family protein [Myxococcota bacterium]|nr:CRTAC1 family protein [Myxococcota bacterium]